MYCVAQQKSLLHSLSHCSQHEKFPLVYILLSGIMRFGTYPRGISLLFTLFSLHPPAFLSSGSPGLTSCLVTAALTLASSRTSARCARRSSPAATTCPNTRRSTAAPGPAELSEPLCDTFSCPLNSDLHPAWPGSGPSSGLLVLHSQKFQKTLKNRLLC